MVSSSVGVSVFGRVRVQKRTHHLFFYFLLFTCVRNKVWRVCNYIYVIVHMYIYYIYVCSGMCYYVCHV